MRPERILADVRAVLPRDAIITTDVGWNKNGVGQQFPIYKPGSILTPGGFATMGFGAPAALGAKIAAPGPRRRVTGRRRRLRPESVGARNCVRAGLAVVWVVMNNLAYGTIAGLQKAHFGTTLGTVFEKDGSPYSPNFAAIARAYGVDGVRIESADAVQAGARAGHPSGKPCRA